MIGSLSDIVMAVTSVVAMLAAVRAWQVAKAEWDANCRREREEHVRQVSTWFVMNQKDDYKGYGILVSNAATCPIYNANVDFTIRRKDHVDYDGSVNFQIFPPGIYIRWLKFNPTSGRWVADGFSMRVDELNRGDYTDVNEARTTFLERMTFNDAYGARWIRRVDQNGVVHLQEI